MPPAVHDPLARPGGRLGLMFPRPFRGRGSAHRHPRTTDRLRAILAKVSLPALVLEFLLLVGLVAVLLGLAYSLTEGNASAHSLAGWWKELFLYLLSFPAIRARTYASGGAVQNRETLSLD